MLIKIKDNQIIVFDNSKTVSSILRSQLYFWEFTYDSNNNIYFTTFNRNIFLKLTSYLNDENIFFELDEEAIRYSKDLEDDKHSFFKIKLLAESYKNGDYDELQFSQFVDFINKNIFRTLKNHQIKAAYHLYLLGNGANFSVPGSGKTSVVLTVYEKLRIEGKVNTLFVVGPPSSFGPWRNEFKETLGRIPEYKIFAGGDKEARKSQYYITSDETTELYLTTFQSLLFDQLEIDHFFKQKKIKVFFVVDEAHYIKQIQGNWAKVILKQSLKTEFRCVLTGTPMPKSYTDIFNLFDFLWPNNEPISSNDKSVIKYYEGKGDSQIIKPLLDEKIGPLFYRVRKTDLKLKQQIFLPPVIIDMNYYERKIYDAIYNKIKDYAQNDYYKNIEFVNKLRKGRIIRLRQAVSYTGLLNTAIEDYDEKLFEDKGDLKSIILKYDQIEVPAKIINLLELIKKLQNENMKVVIWSNFIETINLIEAYLKVNNFHCKKIFGATPIEGNLINDEQTREKIRDEFVAPNSGLDILIANPAACSESISLHKTCHNAIYYDLSYNCAQYLQSLDRIHRVGGSEEISANYYFLQYKNTIDLDIKKNIDKKSKKMFDIIEQDYSIYSLNMNNKNEDSEAYKRLFIKPNLNNKK